MDTPHVPSVSAMLTDAQLRAACELKLKERLGRLNDVRSRLRHVEHEAKALAGAPTVVAIDAAIQRVADDFDELNAVAGRLAIAAQNEPETSTESELRYERQALIAFHDRLSRL